MLQKVENFLGKWLCVLIIKMIFNIGIIQIVVHESFNKN